MSKEIKGYYCNQKKALLKNFRQTVEIMKNSLIEKYGEEMNHSLQHEFISEHGKIIPEIPYFKGFRQRMFNKMLLITAQIIAVYRVLERYNQTPEAIWVLCHEALWLRLQEIPSWKRRLIKLLWHSLFARMLKRRGKRNLQETLGLFKLEYLDGDGEHYDFGINYTQCGHHEFLKRQNAEKIFPYACLADIALSDAFGWGLIRTQTLADGCDYCNFRFKKDAVTQISSKTPGVQKMIDFLTLYLFLI